jgi:hypothetical protein
MVSSRMSKRKRWGKNKGQKRGRSRLVVSSKRKRWSSNSKYKGWSSKGRMRGRSNPMVSSRSSPT